MCSLKREVDDANVDCTIKLCTFPCQQSTCTEQPFSASKTSVARHLIQFNPLPCQDFCKAFHVEYNGLFSFLPEALYQILHCPYLLEDISYNIEYMTKCTVVLLIIHTKQTGTWSIRILQHLLCARIFTVPPRWQMEVEEVTLGHQV